MFELILFLEFPSGTQRTCGDSGTCLLYTDQLQGSLEFYKIKPLHRDV